MTPAQGSSLIRQTPVQLETPDQMRCRTSAVNAVFIGAWNQLGEFTRGSTRSRPPSRSHRRDGETLRAPAPGSIAATG